LAKRPNAKERSIERSGLSMADVCPLPVRVRESLEEVWASVEATRRSNIWFGEPTEGKERSTQGEGRSAARLALSTARFGLSADGLGLSTAGFGLSTAGFGLSTAGLGLSTAGLGLTTDRRGPVDR
jgi:hypothetical protein